MRKSFEETYPKYPFAPLVRTALAVSKALLKLKQNELHQILSGEQGNHRSIRVPDSKSVIAGK